MPLVAVGTVTPSRLTRRSFEPVFWMYPAFIFGPGTRSLRAVAVVTVMGSASMLVYGLWFTFLRPEKSQAITPLSRRNGLNQNRRRFPSCLPFRLKVLSQRVA